MIDYLTYNNLKKKKTWLITWHITIKKKKKNMIDYLTYNNKKKHDWLPDI